MAKTAKKTKRAEKKSDNKLKAFLRSVYAFPVLLFIPVIILSAFKIHGSSVGMFNESFYGPGHDKSLLFGQPRPIRSDEWLSNTPMTVSQSYNNFPEYNHDVGEGKGLDMTVVKDFPTRGWESIFKPQNWGFFVLPLEQAFALRWLLLSYLLIIAAYFFILELFPARKDLAIILSGILFFTPYLHWWYLYTSFGSIFYTLFALIFVMRLHKTTSKKVKLAFAGGLLYVGVGLALILYPPYQISAALAGLVFYLGWLFTHYDVRNKKVRWKLLSDLLYIGGAAALALLILYAYYIQHKEVIHAIMHSLHPGSRHVYSGDRNWIYFIHEFASQIQYRLQFPGAGINYYTNQSESSNFILYAPFLMIPSLYIVFKDWRKKLKPDWIIISLNVLLVLLFVRQHIPHTDILFKPFGLSRVPNYRLLMGIGLAQFFLLVAYFRRNIAEIFASKRERLFLAANALVAFGFYLWTGLYIHKLYPRFVPHTVEIVAATAVLAAIIYMISRGWKAGLLLLAAFSLFSVVIINPVYHGLGTLTNSLVAKEIRRVSSRDDKWAVMEDSRFENLILSSGRPSATALLSYPRPDMWQNLDPNGTNYSIYNRSAHVVFYDDEINKQSQLTQLAINRFGVRLNPCSDYPKQIDLDFLLSVNPINSKCVQEVSEVHYPQVNFYLYRLR